MVQVISKGKQQTIKLGDLQEILQQIYETDNVLREKKQTMCKYTYPNGSVVLVPGPCP